ncbi:MAG: hypothetical protein JXA14_27515 [Anaerolineae bacterium]|nr:hypothetical protein [Anaerolineae bacterium]
MARALLAADKLHFIVGLAVNPQQVDESGAPHTCELSVAQWKKVIRTGGNWGGVCS